MTVYLTKEELLDLHAFVLTRYGGRLGISSQDRLTSALDAPRQVMFGAELYPDIPSKAAALTFLLLKNRPFVKGNQGTALIALLRFLALNGASLRPEVAATDLGTLIRSVDQSNSDKDTLEQWLRERVEYE
ncbi:MAG TPA: Fic family protein [Roseiflexaceae bacterium]|nr:Fic family protein [Roseiflexaceae bacterium]